MQYIKLRQYKYETITDVVVEVNEEFPNIVAKWITIEKVSNVYRITVKAPYKTDGASGPTIDTPATMVPAVVHDALYELIRCRFLDISYRLNADKVLKGLLERCGCWGFRAKYWYYFVRKFGNHHLKVGEPQDKVYADPDPNPLNH